MIYIDAYNEFCASRRAKKSPVSSVASIAEYIGAGIERTRAALLAEGAAISFRDDVRLYDDAVQTVLAELPSDAQLASRSA